MTCPYCGVFANFKPVHTWQAVVKDRGSVNFAAWHCEACKRPIVGEPSGDSVTEQHPRTFIKRDFPDVPPEIAADAAEAHRCYSVEAYRATAAMARRAIQASAIEKGAPDKKLMEQIDWLAQQGLITQQMRDVAHKIRLGGNLGAHPDKDGLQDVGQEQAQELLVFLDDFFRYVYEIPARLSGLGESS